MPRGGQQLRLLPGISPLPPSAAPPSGSFNVVCPYMSRMLCNYRKRQLSRFAIVARAINTLAPNGALKSKHGLGPYIIGHTIQPRLGNQETTKQGESLHLLCLARADISDSKMYFEQSLVLIWEIKKLFVFDDQKYQLCMVSLMVIDRIRAGSH